MFLNFSKKQKLFDTFFLKNSTGFTLIELLIVIAIMLILISLFIPSFLIFQKDSALTNSAEEIINALRLAQNKTLASKKESQWGVFFTTSTEPNQYVLFKGDDYHSREPFFDMVYNLPEQVEIYEMDLTGGLEVIFYPIIGSTDQSGTISLRLKNDLTKIKTIYLQPFGYAGLADFPALFDSERIKDSRRLAFNYDRWIDIDNEILILTFEDGTVENIIINENINNNQIYWKKEIEVEGEIQKLKIHTLELNNPDYSLFCIHRDRRYNNKAFKLEFSGDGSGTLIEYSADGLITINSSIYATDIQWK